jgi:hypothetical protein
MTVRKITGGGEGEPWGRREPRYDDTEAYHCGLLSTHSCIWNTIVGVVLSQSVPDFLLDAIRANHASYTGLIVIIAIIASYNKRSTDGLREFKV